MTLISPYSLYSELHVLISNNDMLSIYVVFFFVASDTDSLPSGPPPYKRPEEGRW